jgi:hypothetical protein
VRQGKQELLELDKQQVLETLVRPELDKQQVLDKQRSEQDKREPAELDKYIELEKLSSPQSPELPN